jgi:hypothetical protein
MSLVPHAAVLCALTFLANPLAAQEKPLLKDANGDPLPPGAIARLGTQAFRVAAPVEAVRFLDGGSKFLVKTRDADYRIDGCFQLFDAQTGKELYRFTSRMTAEQEALRRESMRYYTFPEWCLSPNGKWVARVDPVVTKRSNGRMSQREKSWRRSKPPSVIFVLRCFLPIANTSR